MKWCELWKYKWNEDVTIAVEIITCSVKHSGATGEAKNRTWYNSSTERLPHTFLIDWHSTKQPIKISSACTILGMQISHNGNNPSTSSPGPSPRSKWRSEKLLAKAAEILHESWSILSRDTWWNGFFRGCFQRLAALFVFCHRKP